MNVRRRNFVKIDSDTVAKLLIDVINDENDIIGITFDEDLINYGQDFPTLIWKEDIINGVSIDQSKFDYIDDEEFFKKGVRMELPDDSDLTVHALHRSGGVKPIKVKIVTDQPSVQ